MNPADRHLHPVDQEALRIYDRIWAIANTHREDGRTILANNLEDLAKDLYDEVQARHKLRW